MAAVTVTNLKRNVEGNQRRISATLTIAANNDTWATGLRFITAWGAMTNNSTTQVGGTVSGGTITFKAAGAEAAVYAWAQGW